MNKKDALQKEIDKEINDILKEGETNNREEDMKDTKFYGSGDWAKEMREKEKALIEREGIGEKDYICIEDVWEEDGRKGILVCLDGLFSSKQLKAIVNLVDEADELYLNKVDFISKGK